MIYLIWGVKKKSPLSGAIPQIPIVQASKIIPMIISMKNTLTGFSIIQPPFHNSYSIPI